MDEQDISKKQRVKDFFDGDADDYLKYKYQDNQSSYMYLRQKEVIECLKKCILATAKNKIEMLDAGCGPGLLIEALHEYDIHYNGLDLSENMLKLAKGHFSHAYSIGTPRLMRADIENIPLKSNSLDLVVSLGVIEYLEKDKKALSEFYRILKPNGYFLTVVTNKYSYNLCLDSIIEVMKKIRSIRQFMSLLKIKLKMGEIKPREFAIRKHSPFQFQNDLTQCKFKLLHDKFIGFNALPYPLHIFLGRANASIAQLFDRIGDSNLKVIGEGYLVLCQKLPKELV